MASLFWLNHRHNKDARITKQLFQIAVRKDKAFYSSILLIMTQLHRKGKRSATIKVINQIPPMTAHMQLMSAEQVSY